MTLISGAFLMACTSSTPTMTQSTSSDALLLGNGVVYTGDESGLFVPADVLIENGRILHIGSAEEALALRPGARRINLTGKTLLPGLVDAHAHLAGLGQALDTVSLVGSTSEAEMLERVARRHEQLPPGEWLLGRGWDQNEWPVQEFPTAKALDRVVGDRPVWLTRVDGHASLASSAAMRAAGITASTPDPAGGRIVRDAAGNPTGVFIDRAEGLVERVIPPPSRERAKARLAAATADAARHGLTGVHDAGMDQATIDLILELAEEDNLPIRVYVMLSDEPGLLRQWFERGPLVDPDGPVQVRAIKLYADGALGSRGAALLEPYSDDPDNTGLLLTSPEHITDIAQRARQTGFQVGTHGIGDRAVRIALDAYEKAGVLPSDRFRIEHLQVATPSDLERTARMGVIASMQPTHATSDMNWAEDRVGPQRIRGAYAWQTLAQHGAVLALGSDFPVERVDPFLGIRAAATRQDSNGNPPGGWYPEERLTLAQAIDGFTSGAAYASFTEDRQGRIAPGFLADITIVDAPPDQLTLIPAVRMTIVNGRIVYDSESSTSSK